MLHNILTLLLEVATGLLAGACLLRMYMQFQRIPMSARSGNPLGHFIFAVTDWLVLPLRRVLPAVGRVDTASLVGAYLLQLAKVCVLWLMEATGGGIVALAVFAVFEVLRMALSGLTGLVFVYAVLSWVQTASPVFDLVERLVSPLLAPIRRALPLVGGVDLSALALLVLLQIAAIVLGSLQGSVLTLL